MCVCVCVCVDDPVVKGLQSRAFDCTASIGQKEDSQPLKTQGKRNLYSRRSVLRPLGLQLNPGLGHRVTLACL